MMTTNEYTPIETQCPLVTAMKLAQEHNVTLEFCPKCVHATIGYTCSTIQYAHVKDKDTAALMAVEECIDRFNQLSGVKS